MFKLWPFRCALTWVVLLSSTGPILVLLALLSGATLLDGLFGEYKNNYFQHLLLGLGVFGFIIGIVVSTAIGLFSYKRYNKQDGRYMYLLVPSVICLSLVLVFAFQVFITVFEKFA